MNGHHLILGRLTDIVSGESLDDTLDERHRQKIGRLLIEKKRYEKRNVKSRHELEFEVDGKCARLLMTYLIRIHSRIAMIVQYGPGSLVTRHRPALALGRLVAGYQVPVVVVTNGEQADILDGASGQVEATGLERIPNRDQLEERTAKRSWVRISEKQSVMEARILMAYEVDDRCPCDDSVCAVKGD